MVFRSKLPYEMENYLQISEHIEITNRLGCDILYRYYEDLWNMLHAWNHTTISYN
jgi:hypothetical protein